MKKFEKIAVSAITLSVVSILTVVAMIAMWICESRKICVVNLESFIGAIVALLAIIVTLVLGWQIFNIFELKNKIDEVNELKKQVLEQQDSIKQLTNRTLHLTVYTWAKSTGHDKKWLMTFRHSIKALEYSLKLKKPINIRSTMALLELSSSHMRQGCLCKKEYYDEVLGAHKSIKSLNNYNLIKHNYEPLYVAAIKKLKIREQNKEI